MLKFQRINKNDYKDKFAAMYKQARLDAGRTQEYVAKKLGVSISTVQAWESGYSAPNQLYGFMWFKALGLQPVKYYLRILYPDCADHTGEYTAAETDKLLCKFITDLPAAQKRKLIYCFSGIHGSSPIALLELVCAYLQLDLPGHVILTETTIAQYELAKRAGTLKTEDVIEPNIDLIKEALERAKAAVVESRDSYTSLPDMEE